MLVVKLSICVVIVLICTILGMKKSKRYEIREKVIIDFITVFKSIENDIKYMLISLPDALEKVRHTLNTETKDVLGAISVLMLSNIQTNDMNKKINEEINSINELNSYDKEIIYQGISNLGKADADTQIGIIDNTVINLNNQLSEANSEKLKNCKLYRTLGTAVGLMIAIVFI